MKILIVLPVYNEEAIIKKNLEQLVLFCQKNLTDDWRIIVADNQSTDKTAQATKELTEIYPQATYFYLDKNGKGLAVKTAWQKFPADIYCFMDADLAVDLAALPRLVGAVKEGMDIAIGSRRLPGSAVKRSWFKKVISWSYNYLVRKLLKSKISDHPCGFKAVNRKIVEEILPLVKDNRWFFDTEMLVLAERRGYKIKEVPVRWSEPTGRKSSVKILSLIIEYFKQVWQLRKSLKI